MIRYYSVSNGVFSELYTNNYLEGYFSVRGDSEASVIAEDGLRVFAVVAYKSNPASYPYATEPGIYFRQDASFCVHSLTINEYEGLPFNMEKIPTELLPEDIGTGGGGGVSSWNDLTDRPFGETIVKGDTLTWDGDMTGKVYAEMEIPVDDEGNTTTAYVVKVSDAIPTFEELQSGGIITAHMGGTSNVMEWGNDKDLHYIDMGNAMLDENGLSLPVIAKEDNTNVMGMFTLPEKGVYIMSAPAMGVYVGSFTINNYTGFEATEVKTIDPKYLPESHQFGEITVMSDTLTWDGDMIGKPVVSLDMGGDGVMNFCKVSEAVPTIEDLSDGLTMTVAGIGTESLPADELDTGAGYIYAQAAAIVSKPNTTVEVVGLTFPETGTWLIQQSMEGMSMYIGKITIPNYTGFETMEINPINSKYLPEPLQFGEGVVYRDKLTWDGDPTGLDAVTIVEGYSYMYRVSDSVPTLTDLLAGYTVVNNEGRAANGGAEDITIMGDAFAAGGVLGSVIFVPKDGTSVGGTNSIIVPRKGTYFVQNRLDSGGPLNWVAEFSINNFKFSTTGIKPLDSKYLPTDYIQSMIDTSLGVIENGSY